MMDIQVEGGCQWQHLCDGALKGRVVNITALRFEDGLCFPSSVM